MPSLDHAGHHLVAVIEALFAGALLGVVVILWLHWRGLRWTWALTLTPVPLLASQVSARASIATAIGVGLAAASQLRQHRQALDAGGDLVI